jgi:hypothetical protein
MDLYLKEPLKDDCAVRKMRKRQLRCGEESDTSLLSRLLEEFEKTFDGKCEWNDISEYIYNVMEGRYDRYIAYRLKKEIIQKYCPI